MQGGLTAGAFTGSLLWMALPHPDVPIGRIQSRYDTELQVNFVASLVL